VFCPWLTAGNRLSPDWTLHSVKLRSVPIERYQVSLELQLSKVKAISPPTALQPFCIYLCDERKVCALSCSVLVVRLAPMEHQVPEWEGVPPASSKPGFFAKRSLFTSSATPKEAPAVPPIQPSRPTLKERFDRIIPPYRTYFGRSRRTFLLVLLAIFLCLLALTIGLGVCLGRKKSS
jgi:hypothetical protein